MNDGERSDGLTAPRVDRAFDVLSRRPRRRLLLSLLETTGPSSPSDYRARGPDERREIMLRHVHLPRLEDAGYVEWDREADTVSEGPNFAEIEPLLHLLAEHEDDLPPGWP